MFWKIQDNRQINKNVRKPYNVPDAQLGVESPTLGERVVVWGSCIVAQWWLPIGSP